MSSDFKIKVNEVRSQTDDIVRCVNKLNSIISSAESIKNRLQTHQVYSSLQNAITTLNSEKDKMMKMHINLHSILREYDNAERKIKSNANVVSNVKKPGGSKVEGVNPITTPNKNSAEDSSGGSYNRGSKEKPVWGELINDFKDKSIGKDAIIDAIKAAAGPLGDFIDLPGTFEEGNVGKIIGSVIGTGWDVIDNFKGTDTDWADWFDLGTYEHNPLGDFFDISDTSAKISTACNWAATILETGYDNLQEHGGLSGRFLGETAVETGIKVGEGILIGAGVGALVVAAGVSAPAWAVGAAVVGVTVVVDKGLDTIVSWATQGEQTSWVEAASDGICNAVEKGAKSIKEGLGNLKNGIQNLMGSKCSWGKLKFG